MTLGEATATALLGDIWDYPQETPLVSFPLHQPKCHPALWLQLENLLQQWLKGSFPFVTVENTRRGWEMEAVACIQFIQSRAELVPQALALKL